MENEFIISKNFIDIEKQMLKSNNWGVHKGKMGYVLYLFAFSFLNNDKVIKKQARKWLNYIMDNISKVNGYDFENGLMGIGYAVNWLIENNFVKGISDEVLEELDDVLYREFIYTNLDDGSLEKGSSGRVLYSFQRIFSKNSNRSYYREITLKEMLYLSIDEWYNHLVKNDGLTKSLKINIENSSSKQKIQLSQSLQLSIMLNETILNHYISDIYTLINYDIKLYITKILTEQLNIDIKIELLTILDAYENSCYYFRDNEGIILIKNFNEKYKNERKKIRKLPFSGWYPLFEKLMNNNERYNWKTIWLM